MPPAHKDDASAAKEAGAERAHKLSHFLVARLNVDDLDTDVAFHTALLGSPPPAKVRPGT